MWLTACLSTARGNPRELQHGVYVTFTGPPGRDAELWAVALRAGPRGALSHWTAAELYGLVKQRTGLVHVTVPVGERRTTIRGAAVHYSRSLDLTRHPALLPPRTRVEDTVLDLTQVSASRDEAFDWICRAVGNRLTTADRLLQALGARRRVRGRTDLLIALGDVADGARSVLERGSRPSGTAGPISPIGRVRWPRKWPRCSTCVVCRYDRAAAGPAARSPADRRTEDRRPASSRARRPATAGQPQPPAGTATAPRSGRLQPCGPAHLRKLPP